MIVLGLHSGFFLGQHDASAALVVDGAIVAACEEERFLRVKSPCGVLPIESIRACLQIAGIGIEEVDLVVHPGATMDGLAERVAAYLRHFFGFAPTVELTHHHLAHLASAFYAADLPGAVALSYDAWGERVSTAVASERDGRLSMLSLGGREQSLGLFYGVITSYLGFRPGEDEFKVMGLAAFGEERYDLSGFLAPAGEGLRLDLGFVRDGYEECVEGEPLYGPRLVELCGPPRRPGEPIEDRHRAVARSAQVAFERAACSLAEAACRRAGTSSLCLAGGGALNCATNRHIASLPTVEHLFVQPAASDRGLSLGCALLGAAELGDQPQPMRTAQLGRAYDEDSIAAAAAIGGLVVTEVEDPAGEVAEMLADGLIVGWFQGRSEFGPRALGSRSILADPRDEAMRDEINARVKFREEFRPFAPAVGLWRAPELLEVDGPSPYMTVACRVRDDWVERLGAVTHVDGTARLQTVADPEAGLGAVVHAFERRTGVPAVLNTSFNVRGQPIVETPLDAVATFAATGLDAICMGPFLARKRQR